MSDNKNDFEFLKEIEEYEQQQKEEKADDVKVFEWDDEINDDGIQEESPSVASCEVSEKNPGKVTAPAQTEPKKTMGEEALMVSDDDYRKKTSRESVRMSLLDNIDKIRKGSVRVWKTGIKELDEQLDGGFFPKQVIFLGAIPSLGKTSLALQIADNIARNGQDVLIFSLETDAEELLAKSISRATYTLTRGNLINDKIRQENRLTTRDILKGEVGDPGTDKRKLFDEAVKQTMKTEEYLKYIVGVNDMSVDLIAEYIKAHKRLCGRNPFVIIDYLQILRPSEKAKAEKIRDKRLLTDDDATQLKTLSRDLEIPIMAISAFNRTSYLEAVTSSSFRESSGIEYSADVLLGMQYTNMDYKKYIANNGESYFEDEKSYKARVRNIVEAMDHSKVRNIELKVLKSKNGMKGSVFFDFNAEFNYYEVTGTYENPPKEFLKTIINPHYEQNYAKTDSTKKKSSEKKTDEVKSLGSSSTRIRDI